MEIRTDAPHAHATAAATAASTSPPGSPWDGPQPGGAGAVMDRADRSSTIRVIEETVMDQIPSTIIWFIVFVVVAMPAIIVRRRWGAKRRLWLWVWIASMIIMTGVILCWAFYQTGTPLPSTRQDLFARAILSVLLFMPATGIVGLLIWGFASWGPPSPQPSLSEMNYFPFHMPMEKLGDTYGLTSILQRYDELLETFTTALDSALASTPAHPYQSIPYGLYGSFRTFSPSYQQRNCSTPSENFLTAAL
jgi:hypothetical protein